MNLIKNRATIGNSDSIVFQPYPCNGYLSTWYGVQTCMETTFLGRELRVLMAMWLKWFQKMQEICLMF